MDWTKVSLALEYNYLRFRKYWKLELNTTFIGAFAGILAHYFQGAYIQHNSSIANYLPLVIIGFVLSVMYTKGYVLASNLSSLPKLKRCFLIYKEEKLALLMKFIYALIDVFLRFLAFIIFATLFYTNFVSKIILAFLTSFIILLTSFLTMAITSPIELYFRDEGPTVVSIIYQLASMFVPTSFLLSYFWFYRYLVLNPPAIVMEELRKFILTGHYNLNMLLMALVISLVYGFIGLIGWKLVINKMKKEGTIGLV